MLKYVDTLVGFREIPDEITLCINISNCPCKCEGCHSSYLANDIGKELNQEELSRLITKNTGITCVSFMGGDSAPKEINSLASYVKYVYPNLKTAWYSGRAYISPGIELENFNFIKIGPYLEGNGSLDNPNTNQKMYEIRKFSETTDKIGLFDITNKFWKNESNT